MYCFGTSSPLTVSVDRNPPLALHHQSPVCLSFLTDRVKIDLEIERFTVQIFDGNTFDNLFVVLDNQFTGHAIDYDGHRLPLESSFNIVGAIVNLDRAITLDPTPVALTMNRREPSVRINARGQRWTMG